MLKSTVGSVPAGNWCLIGSEVERDQLALAESQGKRGFIRQKWKKREGLERVGWQCASIKIKKNSGLVLIRCAEAL